LKKYADNYVNYCEAVECKFFIYFMFNIKNFSFFFIIAFSNLPISDRKQLTLNSVHAIRYLWLHKQNKNLNYFSLADNDTSLDVINEIFPVFKKADAYFKDIHDTVIRNLCLDSKEFSIFSALIIFTGGSLFFLIMYSNIF
jgi:hypothetical protein